MRPRKLPTIHLTLPGAQPVRRTRRERVDAALASARQGNFVPMFGLSDADHEYILANGLHGRATDVSRKRAREIHGFTEEQIRRHYPPCDCQRCTEWRIEKEMAGG
jgi:hypothetical protein